MTADYEVDSYIPTLTLLDPEMVVLASDEYSLWSADWALLGELVD